MTASRRTCAVVALACLVAACASGTGSAPATPSATAARAPAGIPSSISSLRLLGTAVVARGGDGALKDFGGISGADRDASTGLWYLLSDDRSERAPARFYEARIAMGPSELGPIEILRVVTLQGRDGRPFPPAGSHGEVPDPEALRVDPWTSMLCWSSEGDRRLGLDPFVRWARADGSHAGELTLPANLHFERGREHGPRHNLTIEGLAFAPDGASLWVSMEAPLYQDGPVPTSRTGALVRFTRIARDGRVMGQYAYPVDAVPREGTGGRRRSDNGVSEILALGNDRLLVVERAGHETDELVFGFNVRLYEARVDSARDVASVDSLQAGEVVPMRKRLVLDLAAAGIGHIDNIEAAAWGPTLPNGHATLLLISDDNFSSAQATRFLTFEVMP